MANDVIEVDNEEPTVIELGQNETAIIFRADGTSSLILPKDYATSERDSSPSEINAIRCAAMLSTEKLIRLVDLHIFTQAMEHENDKELH